MKQSVYVLIFLIFIIFIIPASVEAQKTETLYLSGHGKDDAVLWDFYCTDGHRSKMWQKIPVPSNWELCGFGNYNYGHDSPKSDEQGIYKYQFQVPDSWKNKTIQIVFEGVMTDAEVWINRASAGPLHQGGFYRFKYDITGHIRFDDKNLLEVHVSKVSANKSIEQAERKADYWVFGGIYRPVYLQALPNEYIEWTAIDAKANGEFLINVYPENINSSDTVTARILDLNDKPVSRVLTRKIEQTDDMVTLTTHVKGHKNWTAETPNLYKVRVNLMDSGKVIHTLTEKFGFRTFEVKSGEGLYLNGNRIRLKGVNRHSFWPDSGRCLSKEISYADVRLIKSMNMNAVRMSHYPPDTHFLDVCDELGLYVLDELAGWQKPPYNTPTGKRLVKQIIMRDVNHPSILFWDNGNEGGWNTDLDNQWDLYDPQKRSVLHPWELFSDVDTDHYEGYSSSQRKLQSGNLYMPTEFLHGLYDGGHGAGLEDYWNLLNSSPLGAGGFLWCLVDEGVVRTDKDGWIDTDGNHAPDGIVGPYRQKEGSFYTIKQLYSPIQIDMERLPDNFSGSMEVENRFYHTNLNQCGFEWKLVKFPLPWDKKTGFSVIDSGIMKGPDAKPGTSAAIQIDLPSNWDRADALYLTGIDNQGMETWTWSWPILKKSDICKDLHKMSPRHVIETSISGNVLKADNGSISYLFNMADGTLNSVIPADGDQLFFNNGPRLVTSNTIPDFKTIAGEIYKVSAITASGSQMPNVPENVIDGKPGTRWSAEGSGQWIQLDLGKSQDITTVGIAWQNGASRRAFFDVLVSSDGRSFETAYSGKSSGLTESMEAYKIGRINARYVRIAGKGNSQNDWNSILEVQIAGQDNKNNIQKQVTVKHYADKSDYIIESGKSSGLDFKWTIFPNGILKLDYDYSLDGNFDFFGITFNCPEENILGRKYLGAGPYRVWKNRMKGTSLCVWENQYNDSTPGEIWAYPEFKGYFGDFYWTVINTRQGRILIANETDGLALRIGTPRNGLNPSNTARQFPEGDISIMHAINPIGTKFKNASDLGPQSQKTKASGKYSGTIYLQFMK